MSKEAYEIDNDGYIINNYLVGGDVEISDDCITVPLPQPNFHRPKWTGSKWVEGATQEELEEITVPAQPSDKERIDVLEDTILFLLGGI